MRGRPVTLSRQPAGDPRRVWLQFVELVRDLVRRTLAGDPVDAFETADLRRAAEAMRAPFPAAHASATFVASATVTLVRAYTAAGLPEHKRAIAGVLDAAAAFLDAQLTAQGHALAQQSRRAAGETE